MARKKVNPGTNSAAAEELLIVIERLERLEGEKRNISDDIKDLKQEAKSRGFSVKAIERIVKERSETESQKRDREEAEQLTEVYRAALGMLGGTPLGEAARKRLSQPQEAQDAPDEDDGQETLAPETITSGDIDAARSAGQQAFQQGVKVIANPFVAGDPRRAAWDEGWCRAAGSDGMDIPEAWRRRKTDKPKKPGESEA